MRKKILNRYFFGFFACFICLLSSCGTSSKLSFKKKEVLPYTEEELHLILAIEFLKTNIYGCAPDCLIKVESTFEFFSMCHLDKESEKAKNKLAGKRIKVPEGSYFIEGFGRIDFYNYLPSKASDWQFTPLYQSLVGGKYHLDFIARNNRNIYFYTGFDINFGKIVTNGGVLTIDPENCNIYF
jgi:hypothetical protein